MVASIAFLINKMHSITCSTLQIIIQANIPQPTMKKSSNIVVQNTKLDTIRLLEHA
jgi:hypothetical protein